MKTHLEVMNEELKAGKAQLIDVREQGEWDMGHLKGATLIPLSEISMGLEPENIDFDKKSYLYCRAGNRVYAAQPILEGFGFNEVIPLDEGFQELVSEGFAPDV